ncbi:MAG: hypothetical protein SVZ03_06835 [Spirochaetota bacterium]|nr:hypothetical protein [Spirochaetota bacterium]
MGNCPVCNGSIGPMAILASWDSGRNFTCLDCEKRIGFRLWPLVIVALLGLMIFAERMLHQLIISDIPLALCFAIASILSTLVMFIIPMIWQYKEADTE